MGVVPTNTTLRVLVRANNSDNVNTGASTVSIVNNSLFDFGDTRTLDTQKIRAVQASIECNNEEPIVGDTPRITSEELKMRVYNTFGAQNRAVTEKDYEALIYNMPPEYGSIKRARILRDNDSFKRNINVYVVSEDVAGSIVSSGVSIKQNIKTWLNKNRMINDTIDVLDAKIVNLQIKFKVISDLEADNTDVLRRCVDKIRREFAIKKHIGEAFFISDIYSFLKTVEGVNDVKWVKVIQKKGFGYSDLYFDVEKFTSSDGRYIEAPNNVIFEIKYPINDIVGEIS